MITQTLNNTKFEFYIPIELKKGYGSDGDEIMEWEGIGSTNSQDSQGEILIPEGFDLTEFKVVNWNHQGSRDAAAIIGEPTEWRVQNGQLWVKGILYPEVPMAKAVWNLMKAYKNSSKRKLKLALSVEGKALERDPDNPMKVTKAKITGIAICPHPINGDTWADMITKGFHSEKDIQFSSEDVAIMKAISMEEEGFLAKEDVEGKKNKRKKEEDEEENKKPLLKKLQKSEIYKKIFHYFYPIEFSKARQIYRLLKKFDMVTEEQIQKAFEILDLVKSTSKENDGDIEGYKKKLLKSFNVESPEDLDEEQKKTFDSKVAQYIKKGQENEMEEEEEQEEEQKEEQEEEVTKSRKKVSKSNNSDLYKALQTIEDTFDVKLDSVGTILKGQQDIINQQKELLEKSLSKIEKLEEQIEKIAKSEPTPKSIQSGAYVDKFNKSEDGMDTYILSNPLSVKALKQRLMNESGLLKGEVTDPVLTGIAQELEITKGLSQQSLQYLRTKNINIVG